MHLERAGPFLAGGGEKSNGDNLLAIYDTDSATAFAIEAVRLIDHYHFRAGMKELEKKKKGKKGESKKPMALKKDNSWCSSYFDPNDMHFREGDPRAENHFEAMRY